MSAWPEVDPGAAGLHAAWYTANVAAHCITSQRCECGTLRAPARYRCAVCGSDEWEFVPLTPTGVVRSWTITRRPLHFAFAEVLPYALLVVEVAEGLRFLLHYRGDAESVSIGDRVTIDVVRFGLPFAKCAD